MKLHVEKIDIYIITKDLSVNKYCSGFFLFLFFWCRGVRSTSTYDFGYTNGKLFAFLHFSGKTQYKVGLNF